MNETTHNEVLDPEAEFNKIIHCIEEGKMTLVGDLSFIKSRECEFEDDHEAGLKLRDYVGIASDAAGRVHIVHVSSPFGRFEELERTIAAGDRRFDLIASSAAGDRVVVR